MKLKAFEAEAEVNGVMRVVEFKEVEGAYGKGRLTVHGLTLEETHALLDGMALGHVVGVAPSKGREDAQAHAPAGLNGATVAGSGQPAPVPATDSLEAAKIDAPAPAAAAAGGASDTTAPTRRRRAHAPAAPTDTSPAAAGAEAVKAGQQAVQAAQAQAAQAQDAQASPAPSGATAPPAGQPAAPVPAATTRKLIIVDQGEGESEEAAKARSAAAAPAPADDLLAEVLKAPKLIEVLKALVLKGGIKIGDEVTIVAKCVELKPQVPLLGRIPNLEDRVRRTLEILREEMREE